MSSPRPSKRQRIYRACDQCRRRKSKCDGEQPVCKICHAANRTCTYQTGGGRRGLPSGYVRSLEITLGLVLQNVPGSESMLYGLLRDARGKGNFLKSGQADHLVSVWRTSRLSRDVNQLLKPDGEDLGNDGSDWDPVEPRDQDENMDDFVAVPMDFGSNEPMIMQTVQAPVQNSSKAIEWVMPENTPDLLDFYFTYTHCWFPILERRELLRAMHMNRNQPLSTDTSCHMVLWAVISYTALLRGNHDASLPSPLAIQLSIQEQFLADPGALDLGHVHALLLFVLTQISLGNIHHAWTMAGQATRLLLGLPLTARKTRFRHTFNGCVFLDTILSALLGRTPCLSSDEQLEQGLVEEDDVDEWDVWSATRSNSFNGGRMSTAPLRALSSFNIIQQLVQDLSQILYQPKSNLQLEDLLDNLREKQAVVLQDRPYNRQNASAPPLLVLHLTSTFTTLSLIRRFEPVSPAVTDLCIRTIHRVLDILECYLSIAGESGVSPLVHCFALQCQRSLVVTNAAMSLEEKGDSESRIQGFLSLTKSTNGLGCKIQADHSFEAPSLNQSGPSVSLAPGSAIAMNTITESSLTDLRNITDTSGYTTSAGLSGADGYDALFEEMVTSFPSSRYVQSPRALTHRVN
ncbi:Quinic acid utilization activator [Penicillium subrubescens]|uniref:Quinic acid utilization activator n=1 Tax=Penicillium subrubescens TaxID=1316194 RepID=A0A1Q5T8S1_9EURO|nr:Quinic acid utilization activator [Penicillium subrubescens]